VHWLREVELKVGQWVDANTCILEGVHFNVLGGASVLHVSAALPVLLIWAPGIDRIPAGCSRDFSPYLDCLEHLREYLTPAANVTISEGLRISPGTSIVLC